jgi:hypothetical protein
MDQDYGAVASVVGKLRPIALATLLLKIGKRELQKCTFHRKEALFTPSDTATGYLSCAVRLSFCRLDFNDIPFHHAGLLHGCAWACRRSIVSLTTSKRFRDSIGTALIVWRAGTSSSSTHRAEAD